MPTIRSNSSCLHYFNMNTYLNQSCIVPDIGSHISCGFVLWRTHCHWHLRYKDPQPVKCWFYDHPLGRLINYHLLAYATPCMPCKQIQSQFYITFLHHNLLQSCMIYSIIVERQCGKNKLNEMWTKFYTYRYVHRYWMWWRYGRKF